jgi:hypothetical protein
MRWAEEERMLGSEMLMGPYINHERFGIAYLASVAQEHG